MLESSDFGMIHPDTGEVVIFLKDGVTLRSGVSGGLISSTYLRICGSDGTELDRYEPKNGRYTTKDVVAMFISAARLAEDHETVNPDNVREDLE